MRIGILALQGAFIEHEVMLDKLNVKHFQIRQLNDIQAAFDGLILPGGESTVMKKLLTELHLFEPLQNLIKNDFPVFGTCAGLILLAKEISNDSRTGFQTMDVLVKRNAFGRQLGSFEAKGLFHNSKEIPMIFIRAPYIENVEANVEVLAVHNQLIVAARQKNQLGTAFHPELSDSTVVHEMFIDICKEYKSLNR